MKLTISWNHKLYDFILGVQDYVSEFTKVLDDVLSFELAFDKHSFIVASAEFEVRVLDEFFNNWVQDTIVLFTLGQP